MEACGRSIDDDGGGFMNSIDVFFFSFSPYLSTKGMDGVGVVLDFLTLSLGLS